MWLNLTIHNPAEFIHSISFIICLTFVVAIFYGLYTCRNYVIARISSINSNVTPGERYIGPK